MSRPLQVQQLLLTRFNIRVLGVDWLNTQTPAWLEERIALFAQYCVPSVAAQTERDFDWIVFCDHATPRNVQQRISSLDSRIRIVLVAAVQDYRSVRGQLLAHHYANPGAEVILSTRLDNDDALSCHALSRARAHLDQFITSGHRRWLYNPRLGYRLHVEAGRLFAADMPNSPFLSMFERSDATPLGPYSGNHSKLHERYPTHHDTSERLWLQVIHGGNVSNKVRPGDVETSLADIDPAFNAIEL